MPPAWDLWLSQASSPSEPPERRHPTSPPALLFLTQDAATQMPNGNLPRGPRVNSTLLPFLLERNVVVRKGVRPSSCALCDLPRRHVQTHVSHGGNAGDCQPLPLCPGSQLSLFPSALGPQGPAGPVCPQPRTSVPPPRTQPMPERLPVQPGSAWPQTGIPKPNVCHGHFMCVSVLF